MLWIIGLPDLLRRFGLLALLGAGLSASFAVAAATPPPAFLDLIDHPTSEANWDRFHGLEDRLAAAFFAACGNGGCLPRRRLWPMQLRCSVRVADGTVAACLWVVAGSDLRVRASGHIERDVVVWRCVLPTGPGLAVDAFHAALEVARPLSVRLPGASSTLGERLRTCLSRPGTAS